MPSTARRRGVRDPLGADPDDPVCDPDAAQQLDVVPVVSDHDRGDRHGDLDLAAQFVGDRDGVRLGGVTGCVGGGGDRAGCRGGTTRRARRQRGEGDQENGQDAHGLSADAREQTNGHAEAPRESRGRAVVRCRGQRELRHRWAQARRCGWFIGAFPLRGRDRTRSPTATRIGRGRSRPGGRRRTTRPTRSRGKGRAQNRRG